jgi:hypothetical protein
MAQHCDILELDLGFIVNFHISHLNLKILESWTHLFNIKLVWPNNFNLGHSPLPFGGHPKGVS